MNNICFLTNKEVNIKFFIKNKLRIIWSLRPEKITGDEQIKQKKKTKKKDTQKINKKKKN